MCKWVSPTVSGGRSFDGVRGKFTDPFPLCPNFSSPGETQGLFPIFDQFSPVSDLCLAPLLLVSVKGCFCIIMYSQQWCSEMTFQLGQWKQKVLFDRTELVYFLYQLVFWSWEIALPTPCSNIIFHKQCFWFVLLPFAEHIWKFQRNTKIPWLLFELRASDFFFCVWEKTSEATNDGMIMDIISAFCQNVKMQCQSKKPSASSIDWAVRLNSEFALF